MEFNKKNIKTFILIAFACILFYLGIKNIGLVVEAIGGVLGIMFPFILGAGIAFVINVPMTRIEYWIFHRTDRLKSGRRPLSFLLTLAAVIGVIIIAMYIIVPQIAETMMSIARELPGAINTAQDWIFSKMRY